MSATWQDYRMWRQVNKIVSVAGNSAECAGEWRATNLTFRGRSRTEAQAKAEKFWQDAELGAGSMICLPEGVIPD